MGKLFFIHKHQLKLEEGSYAKRQCRICDCHISERSFYICHLCQTYVHIKCHQIDHQFHPHQLILRFERNQTFICNSCHKLHETDICYTCAQCDFYMDVKCATMPSVTCGDFDHPDQEHIQHFSHQHLMTLNPKMDSVDKIQCFICRFPCSGEVYGCKRCDYFLHKSCAKLPQEIKGGSFHKDHPLFFHIATRKFLTCMLCCKDDLIFTLECRQCSFHFCVNCVTTLRQTVSFEYHEHPLYFIKRTHTHVLQCDGYESYCKNSILSDSEELNHTKSSMFSCGDCNFKVHLLCSLLPRSIQYEYHVHPLILFDSVIKNSYGEYCCDICESERDPRFCVYFCEDCEYVAHVHCLSSQINNILEGDLNDVKMKMVGADLWRFPTEIDYASVKGTKQLGTSVLILKDLIHQLTEYESFLLKKHFYWDEDSKEKGEMSKMTIQHEPEYEKIDQVLGFSNFTETEFMSYISKEFSSTYTKRKLKIKSSDLALKMVDYKDLSIPLCLVSVLNTFLEKYGDIIEQSLFPLLSIILPDNDVPSKAMVNICFFFICKVWKQMHSTLVIDITKDVLQDWYHYITFVRMYARFDMSVMITSLKKITREFFYLHASKILEVDIPAIIYKKMEELRKKLEEYEKFCESTSKKEFMKEGMENVMKLKWKTAGQVGK